jgi:L-alanine-DL-glutamate epimerase-like enolase superfamily enzyme
MAIERIEVFVTDLPGRLQRQVSSGAYDTGPSGSLLGKPVLVKIYADGVVGYGQIRPITPGHFLPDTVHSMVGAITEIYGPRLIGRELFDIEAVWSMFDRALPGNVNARAALDHALHDALGKALGVPVYNLLGGLCQPRIPLEWSVSMADDTATMIKDAMRAVEEFGISVLCLKAGDRRGWKQDVENFIAVRRALGDGVQIGVDPNCRWSVPDAKRAILTMAEHRLDYIEQPIERRDFAGLAAVRQMAQGIPLMADESLMSLQDAFDLARHQAVDVFCIKLYKLGGLRQSKKVAAVAEAADILVNIGGLAAFCQLEAAAGAHFYASSPAERVMPAGEFIFGLGVIGPDPLVPETDFRIDDGHVVPPHRPGLGITVDEAALERYTLRKETVR